MPVNIFSKLLEDVQISSKTIPKNIHTRIFVAKKSYIYYYISLERNLEFSSNWSFEAAEKFIFMDLILDLFLIFVNQTIT